MRKWYWLSSMMVSALLDYLKVKKIEALLDKSSLVLASWRHLAAMI